MSTELFLLIGVSTLAVLGLVAAARLARLARAPRAPAGTLSLAEALAEHRRWLAAAVRAALDGAALPELERAPGAAPDALGALLASASTVAEDGTVLALDGPLERVRGLAPRGLRLTIIALGACSLGAALLGSAAPLVLVPLVPLAALLPELTRAPTALTSRLGTEGFALERDGVRESVRFEDLRWCAWSLTRVQVGPRHLASRIELRWAAGTADEREWRFAASPRGALPSAHPLHFVLAVERVLARRALEAGAGEVTLPLRDGGTLCWTPELLALRAPDGTTRELGLATATVHVEARRTGAVFVARALDGAAPPLSVPWVEVGLPILCEEAWRACVGPYRRAP